jgi:hypothetical protein
MNVCVVEVQLQGGTQEERLADLQQVAAVWGVEVRSGEDGTQTAERRFGPLTVRAAHPGQPTRSTPLRAV